MFRRFDPVPIGLVASLNRPAGNLTGFNVFSGELGAKGLALLYELVPTVSAIGFLLPQPLFGLARDVRSIDAIGG